MRRLAIALPLAVMLLGACATTTSRGTSSPDSLVQWVEWPLAAYLNEQLSTHPRFKGESVMLASVDDG